VLLELLSLVIVPGSILNVKFEVTLLYFVKWTTGLSCGMSIPAGDQLFDLALQVDDSGFEALEQVLVLVLTGRVCVSDGLRLYVKVCVTLCLLVLIIS